MFNNYPRVTWLSFEIRIILKYSIVLITKKDEHSKNDGDVSGKYFIKDLSTKFIYGLTIKLVGVYC